MSNNNSNMLISGYYNKMNNINEMNNNNISNINNIYNVIRLKMSRWI